MDVDKEDLISKIFTRKVIWDKRDKGHAHRNMIDKAWREIAEEIGAEGNRECTHGSTRKLLSVLSRPSQSTPHFVRPSQSSTINSTVSDHRPSPAMKEALLRKKWKNLRDQFAVEIGKCPIPTSRNPGAISYRSKWPFFKSLMFLRDIVKPRTSSGNLITKSKPADEADDGTSEQVSCDLNPYAEPTEGSEEAEGGHDTSPLEDQSMQQSHSAITSRQTRKRVAMTAEYNQKIFSAEEKKAKILGRVLDELTESSTPDCEDLMFFRTLLSHVKKIPPQMKLPFRAKIEEVVQEFAYPRRQPLPVMSPSSHS